MKTKTWKIENSGKVTIEINRNVIKVAIASLANIHFNKQVVVETVMLDDKEVYKKMMDLLLKNTNSKYSKKIMQWVSEQVLSKEDMELVEIMNSVDKKIFRED